MTWKLLGDAQSFPIRHVLEPARRFAATGPSLRGIGGIAVFRYAGGSLLAAREAEHFFRRHVVQLGLFVHLVAKGGDFAGLLLFDRVLGFTDQDLEFLDGRGTDDVVDIVTHDVTGTIVNR